MPRRKSSISEFEKLRRAGIAAASKLVVEHQYDMAKDVFSKLLTLSPNDLEVMTLHAICGDDQYFLCNRFPSSLETRLKPCFS
jgi:hypothetical protein